jgi:ectoine hydroxylase
VDVESNLESLVSAFWRDGYVVRRGAFGPDEVDTLRRAITGNRAMHGHGEAARQKFLAGKYPSFETIFVWFDTAGVDVFTKFTRSYKIVDVLEGAFGGPVVLDHNKVTLKYPNMPGFKHHQDYYYWYTMGVVFPEMATCFIAVDEATAENGCLRLVRGSHRLGRLDHKLFDGFSDSSVDPERLALVLAQMPEDAIEMEPGDLVIFHCNTIHASATNASNRPRLALLGCYNTLRNEPTNLEHVRLAYQPQTKIYDAVTPADLSRQPAFVR